MSRKSGDKNFQTYVSYQAFSSDMPVQQINDSKLWLKIEKKIPAFFIKAENVFSQITAECFLTTAEKSTTMNMSNWKKICEDYFGLPMEQIKCLTIKKQQTI